MWLYERDSGAPSVSSEPGGKQSQHHIRGERNYLKILIFNYIISDCLWSYGDHLISTFIYILFLYLFIYVFIYVFIYQSIYLLHNISPVSLCSVKACHLIKLPPVNLIPAAFS